MKQLRSEDIYFVVAFQATLVVVLAMFQVFKSKVLRNNLSPLLFFLFSFFGSSLELQCMCLANKKYQHLEFGFLYRFSFKNHNILLKATGNLSVCLIF